MIDLVARQKALNFNPGSEWSYSNTNYFLLAEVVKRATKKSLAQFAVEHIFQPLLTPTVLDEFDGEHMILVFRRNAQRRVSGISVFARGDRVRDLTFEKVG